MYYVLAISLVLLADCKFIFAAIALYSAGLRVVGICLGLTFVIITMLFAFIEFEWIFKDISSVEFYRAHGTGGSYGSYVNMHIQCDSNALEQLHA